MDLKTENAPSSFTSLIKPSTKSMSQEVEGFHQPLLNGKYSKSLDAGQDAAAASGSLDPFPTSKGMSDVTSDLPARRTLFSMSSRFSAANTPWWPHTREMYLSSVDGAPVRRPKRRQVCHVALSLLPTTSPPR